MAINLDHVTEQITVTDTAANASLTVNPKGTGAFNIAAGGSGINLSNGGTVTGITSTDPGSAYTSVPTVNITAPTTAGGVQAVITTNVAINVGTIGSGGTGYTVGNVLTLVGGTTTGGASTWTVASVSGGVVTSVTSTSPARYTAFPALPASVTGGSGSGFTFSALSGFVNQFVISNAGSGYVEQPTISFTGGGGSNAAAYATLGSGVAALRGLTGNFAIYTPAGEHTRFVDNGQGNTYWTVYSNPTLISPNGSATNIPASFSSKGASGINLYTNTGNQLQAVIAHTASAVNYVQLSGAATGSGPTVSAQGSDTNADLNLTTKGTGSTTIYTPTSVGGTASNSQNIVNFQGVASGNLVLLRASLARHTTSADWTGVGYRFGHVVDVTPMSYIEFNPVGQSQGLSVNVAASSPFQVKTTGGEQLRVSNTASAVNYIQATGAATGGNPTILSQGSDTNINLVLSPKGTGALVVNPSGGYQFTVVNTPSTVNWLEAKGGATGSGPQVSAVGTDTNIDLNVTAKGTGGARFNVGNGSKYTYLSSDAANNFQLVGAANTANLGIYATGGGSIRFYTATGLLEEQLRIPQTASAVNFVQVTGSVTGSPVAISAQGSDSNIRMNLFSKGTESIDILTNGGAVRQARFTNTASTVNWVQMTGSATGFGAVIRAAGSDTNIPLVVQPQGTGALQAQQTDSTATGGNARGAYSVDFQRDRDAATKVASGTYSVLAGGQNNTASGSYAFIGGGFGNVASGSATTLISGSGNTATGPYSGGLAGFLNTISGYFSFVGAGASNTTTSSSAVTTQSATMNGTTAVTLSGSNASIKVGQFILGTSISFGTYVAAISGTSLTLSQAASGSSTSTLSFYTPHGVVVGGGNNQATGSYSFIGGGGDAGTAGYRNRASGDWSFVGGGQSNIASGAGSFIGGGGTYGLVGGNTASGQASAIAGGINNVTSGFASSVGGGNLNTASGQYSSIMGGVLGTTRSIYSNNVFPSFAITATSGVSQAALLVLARQTTDATATVITSDGSAASTTNQVILPNNSAYFFTGEVVAGVTGGGNTKGWTIEGVIKRGANAAATTLVGSTVTSTYGDAGASTWVIALSADTTNGGLAVTFTGQLATTIRCVAQIRTTEMTF